MSDETLARQISDSDNSIGWILFHMSRVVDVFMNARFQGKPQIWIEDGWCEKFGLSDDPETTIVHGGQIAFLRGHLEGMGWFV